MQEVINLDKVTKTYKKPKSNIYIKAIDNISFAIKEGEVVGLLGPNGAGKSTIIKILCGLTKADSGKIEIFNKEKIYKNNSLGVVLEGNRNLYWNMTVNENIRFILSLNRINKNKKKDIIEFLIYKFKLNDKVNELVSNLSRGMQQKVAILIALLMDSSILILDEPTLGLDVDSIIEIKALLNNISSELNKTILISSHNMKFIEDICERVIIINKGVLITDNKIDDLKNYFKLNIYEISYKSHDNRNVNILLEKENINGKYDINDDLKNITISDIDGKDLANILNILIKNDIAIVGIKSKIVEMEEIFLKIIGGNHGIAN